MPAGFGINQNHDIITPATSGYQLFLIQVAKFLPQPFLCYNKPRSFATHFTESLFVSQERRKMSWNDIITVISPIAILVTTVFVLSKVKITSEQNAITISQHEKKIEDSIIAINRRDVEMSEVHKQIDKIDSGLRNTETELNELVKSVTEIGMDIKFIKEKLEVK
jgi:hypothetical protein